MFARIGPLSVGASAFTILLTFNAVHLGPLSVQAVVRLYRSSSERPLKACRCLGSSLGEFAQKISRGLRHDHGRLFRLRGALDSPPDRSGRSSFCPFSVGVL